MTSAPTPRSPAHMHQKEAVQPEAKLPEPKLSKAERRAQHAQLNRQIWESAFVCPSWLPNKR
jgi:hypothetical protein